MRGMECENSWKRREFKSRYQYSVETEVSLIYDRLKTMSELPEDPNLTNFLRQHRSIAQSAIPQLEDRLMLEIDLLPTKKQRRVYDYWQRYTIGSIGLIVTGIVGVAIFQILNPPEQSIAELDRLNLFLEAHAPSLSRHPELDLTEPEDLDLDLDLF